MSKAEILRGIEGHQWMQAEIGAAILEHGGLLSQDDFDREFGWMGGKLVPGGIDGDCFILAPFGGPQQEYLHLAQLMMAADVIDAFTGDDGRVYYCFNE